MAGDKKVGPLWLFVATIAGIAGSPAEAFASRILHSRSLRSVPVYSAASLAKIRGDHYAANMDGVRDLCSVHPDLCAYPDTEAAFNKLRKKRRIGFSLYGAAGAAYAGGLVYGAYRATSSETGAAVAVYGGLGVGTVLALAASAVLPQRGDYATFLDRVNLHQSETPTQWLGNGFRGSADSSTAFNVALRF